MAPRPGPRNALTDVDGLLVGAAHDRAIVSGVTVVLAERPATCAGVVLGGGPGTRETDLLAPENLVEAVDAIVLSGGSVYGLAAADAAAAALGARGRGFTFGPGIAITAPIVPGAILFDLINGGDKAWGETPPYARLGRAALEAAGPDVALGAAGAGFGAMAGALQGGQGSASLVLDDGVTVAALACVNSFGSVVMPGTRTFWAWPFEIEAEFGGLGPPRAPLDPVDWGLAKQSGPGRENTTLAVVATNAALTKPEAKRVAHMASAGLARAIRPVFAPTDGDVIFALATGTRAAPLDRPRDIARIGAVAADCLARAVARGVYHAHAVHRAPAWRDLAA
jgi:L-aminopeptidase/D-esterase-like protein